MLKYTKFDFRWVPPQTSLGELTALPTPLYYLREPTFKGKWGRGAEGKRKGEEMREREEVRQTSDGEPREKCYQ